MTKENKTRKELAEYARSQAVFPFPNLQESLSSSVHGLGTVDAAAISDVDSVTYL